VIEPPSEKETIELTQEDFTEERKKGIEWQSDASALTVGKGSLK